MSRVVEVYDDELNVYYECSINEQKAKLMNEDPDYRYAIILKLRKLKAAKENTENENLSGILSTANNESNNNDSTDGDSEDDGDDEINFDQEPKNSFIANILKKDKTSSKTRQPLMDKKGNLQAPNETDTTETGKKRRAISFSWSKPMILLLIHTYESLSKSFNNPNIFNNDCWKKVSKIMNDYGYSDCTAERCRKKFNILKQQYKDVKDHNKTSGNNPTNFEYMTEMEGVLSNEVYMTPVSTATCIKNSSSDSDGERKITPTKRSRKQKGEDLLSTLIKEKKKNREQREIQAANKIAVAEKMIELLTSLIQKQD